MLGNFDDAIKACDTSMNSLGSAEEENAKKLESLDSKFNMMVGAFQELILGDTSLNTLLKLLVDLGTQILKLANNDFVKLLTVTTFDTKLLCFCLEFNACHVFHNKYLLSF